MVRTILTPQQQNITIAVPKNYVGKPIEVLFFALDEPLQDKPVNINNAAHFKGLLTNVEAEKFDAYLQHTRNEWDRNL